MRAATCVAAALLSVAVRGIEHHDVVFQYVGSLGIQAEEHAVITEDGYILGVFRLPRRGAPVVLLQHGILSSSWFWLTNDPSIAPAIQIYNMGYDVWMPNNRGNMFSRHHARMNCTQNKSFWDFTFSEMARYDLPAIIDHILSATGRQTLTYVGHSEGTTQLFAALGPGPMRKALQQKINLFVALSPVAYLGHQASPILALLSDTHIADLTSAAYPYGILSWSGFSDFGNFVCKMTGGTLCKLGVDLVCGSSSNDTDPAIINISAHFPSGTSARNLNHYAQLVLSGEFEEFDYGADNLRVYGQKTPPRISFGGAELPVALFAGTNDDIADPEDVKRIASELSHTLAYYRVFPGYSHITWGAGDRASFREWFPQLQGLLQKYNPLAAAVLV